ncbi:hypothetical protein DUI87_17642 [Hirundo rustica rustica]|uniref:Uncharacterized protein n=1 Tax=Hirundo rustica rustica TaxID=333673 RepID=A0A3M0KG57_HIRRU|nr:hypothetical protein DUI87_17642 [Hirundo rustica rustica]
MLRYNKRQMENDLTLQHHKITSRYFLCMIPTFSSFLDHVNAITDPNVLLLDMPVRAGQSAVAVKIYKEIFWVKLSYVSIPNSSSSGSCLSSRGLPLEVESSSKGVE